MSSLEQSVQEGCILDVLSNYHTVGTLAKLTEKAEASATYDKGYQATYHLVNTAADDR